MSFCSTIPRHDHAASEPTLPPWIELLELTAQAPWLSSVPEDHKDRLRRSYTLLLQIVMYLTGPNAQGTVRDEAAAQQFLLVILHLVSATILTHCLFFVGLQLCPSRGRV